MGLIEYPDVRRSRGPGTWVMSVTYADSLNSKSRSWSCRRNFSHLLPLAPPHPLGRGLPCGFFFPMRVFIQVIGFSHEGFPITPIGFLPRRFSYSGGGFDPPHKTPFLSLGAYSYTCSPVAIATVAKQPPVATTLGCRGLLRPLATSSPLVTWLLDASQALGNHGR